MSRREQRNQQERRRGGAGEVLPALPPRHHPRPVHHPTGHPRHRRAHPGRRVLRRRRDAPRLHRPRLGALGRADLDTGCGPSGRGMGSGRGVVGVAGHRRAAAVPAADRRPTPRRHPRPARRHGASARIHRPRDRGRHDPRPPPRHPHRGLRSQSSGVRAPRPRRAGTPRHLLGPGTGDGVPVGPDCDPPSPRTHPPGLRHRTRGMVGRTRHYRRLVGGDHLRRAHRPGRPGRNATPPPSACRWK